jgi:hypothetical protein
MELERKLAEKFHDQAKRVLKKKKTTKTVTPKLYILFDFQH